jgi:glycerol uptake facilitator-like aquaporin
MTILIGIRFGRTSVPWLVGLCITAAYLATSSASLFNPAVAIARSFTNTFSGIRPVDLPGFIVAQLVHAGCGLALAGGQLDEQPEDTGFIINPSSPG